MVLGARDASHTPPSLVDPSSLDVPSFQMGGRLIDSVPAVTRSLVSYPADPVVEGGSPAALETDRCRLPSGR